jgi:Ca-activated chloride channel family protein
MVTELAHDFSVRIEPASGYRISGLFGLPAEAVRWDGKALLMDVATIFLSKRKGAIYFGLSPDTDAGQRPARRTRSGDELAQVEFGYIDAQDGTRVSDNASCRLLSPDEPQVGLTRGAHLVDEYLTLKKVAQVHLFDNNQNKAFKLANDLLGRLGASRDPDLEPELELVRDINNTLARLSGNLGSIESHDGTIDPISGLPGPGGSLAEDNRYTRRYHR